MTGACLKSHRGHFSKVRNRRTSTSFGDANLLAGLCWPKGSLDLDLDDVEWLGETGRDSPRQCDGEGVIQKWFPGDSLGV